MTRVGRHPLLSAIAARARRSLGIEELSQRLDGIEAGLAELHAARYPNGPLYFGDHTALVATRWGARVIGIDLSAAAEVAAKNLAEREFVAFQADVFSLPFAPESFDCIYSMGVLHHTPDCEKAVKTLPQYLKPGGTLAVWLYSGYNKWYRFSDQYRKITHRLSPRVLHGFFRVAVPFFYWLDRGLRVIPLIGKPVAGLVHHVFPVNRHRDPEIRVLDTLDWYSPKYQSKHTYEQVFRWFESCGLESLSVGNFAVGVRGRKPLGNGRP